MSGYYLNMSNVKTSTISKSAYNARTKIHDEIFGRIFNYTRKKDHVYHHISLPEGCPKEWSHAENLWNANEKFEAGQNTERHGKQFIIAIPQELTQEQAEKVINELQEHLAKMGYASQADQHEPDSVRSRDEIEKNRHVHILTTARRITNGKFEKVKEKKVYANDRDADGKPIYNPDKPDAKDHKELRIPVLDENGEQKYRERPGKGKEMLWERVRVQDNPLDCRETVESIRAEWARICNQYLSVEHKIDHRSYDRQGIDQVAQVHEGIGSHKAVDDRKAHNRQVRKVNAEIKQIKRKGKRYYDTRRSRNRSANHARTDGTDRAAAGRERAVEGRERAADERKRAGSRRTYKEDVFDACIPVADLRERIEGLQGEIRDCQQRQREIDKQQRDQGKQIEQSKGRVGQLRTRIETIRIRTRRVVKREDQTFERPQKAVGARLKPGYKYIGRNIGVKDEDIIIYVSETNGSLKLQYYTRKEGSTEEKHYFDWLCGKDTTEEQLRSIISDHENLRAKRVEAASIKAEAKKTSEGIKVSPAEQKVDTGQNSNVMEGVRQEQTEKKQTEIGKTELKPLQPGKTYTLYADDENGIYIKAKVQDAGFYNTVDFSLIVSGQEQKLDSQLVTKDKTIKDARLCSELTMEKINELRTTAHRKEEAQEMNREYKGEVKTAESPENSDKQNTHTGQRRRGRK